MLTRKQYLDGEVSHEDYYGQFSNEVIEAQVVWCLGKDEVRASTDKHMNDIPLARWDGLARLDAFGMGRALAAANGTGGYSLSDQVCALKAAAIKWKARNQ